MSFLLKKGWQIGALITVGALVFMDQTIVSVALPTIQRELNTSEVALQWCVNAYLLALTVLVLVSGKIGDRIGHRLALSIGVFLFAFSSFICGLSPTIHFLIAGRALQGLGGALMLPAQSTLVSAIFPQEKRGRAAGVIVSSGALFMIIAPLIGGYFTEHFTWRWIFWVNLPIAAIGLLLIQKHLPHIQPGQQKIDWVGFTCFGSMAFFVTLLFMQANTWGWLSWPIVGCILAAVTSGCLLFWREKHTSFPFLDLSLFKRPKYAAINLAISVTQFIMMITVFQTIYFQTILGLTPLETGFLQFTSCIPVIFMPFVGGYLSDKVTPKLPIAIGYLCLIFSFFYFGFDSTPSSHALLLNLIVFSIGIPLIFTPSYSSTMSTIPRSKMGIGFGMLITLRMFSGTLGLALTQLFVATVQQNQLPKVGQKLAEITSFSWVHLALAFLLVIAFALTFLLHRDKSEHQLPPSPAEGWD